MLFITVLDWTFITVADKGLNKETGKLMVGAAATLRRQKGGQEQACKFIEKIFG